MIHSQQRCPWRGFDWYLISGRFLERPAAWFWPVVQVLWRPPQVKFVVDQHFHAQETLWDFSRTRVYCRLGGYKPPIFILISFFFWLWVSTDFLNISQLKKRCFILFCLELVCISIGDEKNHQAHHAPCSRQAWARVARLQRSLRFRCSRRGKAPKP